MLATIRTAIARKKLRRAAGEINRRRRIHTLESARTIGLLFDASPERNRREVLDFVKTLEKKGKKVSLLGFIEEDKNPGEHPFPFFTPKELNWDNSPKSDKAAEFSRQNFDLLLSFNPSERIALAWPALQSPAGMKIGFVTSLPNDFDMLLEIPADKGLRFFVEQLDLYLDKIVLTSAHEPAKTP